jgi:uncharacterized membrane protein YjfL (UPF0719 family)
MAIAAVLYVGKILFDRTTDYGADEELTTRDNPAVGTVLALYFLGVAVALSGLAYGFGASVRDDLLNVAIYGPLTLVLVRLSILINDKLILYRFSLHDEIVQDRNLGTAFVVGGGCVATGLTISGALSGESLSPLMGLVDLLYYYTLGQILLVVAGQLFQLITSYDIHHVIGQDDNAAAGLSFGGFLVAMGVVARVSLAGASSNLLAETVTTVAVAAVGVILLVAMRIVTDRLILPKSPLSKEIVVDRNLAAGAISAATFVSVAVVYAVSLGA